MSIKNYKLLAFLLLVITISVPSCKTVQNVKLNNTSFEMVNREAITTNQEQEVEIKAKEGAGLAMMNEVEFEAGVIEIQIKGENKPGQSFVGIAFNVQDQDTYEAIYFRPFNFLSNEKIRREHAIQYINPPDYEWRKLRDEQEGVFEAEFHSPPDPDDWFSVKLNISPTTVEVVDSRNGKILLAVKRLTEQKSNKIALWTGHNSKGVFQKLKLTKT